MGKVSLSIDDRIAEMRKEKDKEKERLETAKAKEEARIESELREAREKATEILKEMAQKNYIMSKPAAVTNSPAANFMRDMKKYEQTLKSMGVKEKERQIKLREYAKEYVREHGIHDPKENPECKDHLKSKERDLIERAYAEAKKKREERDRERRMARKGQKKHSRVHDLEKGAYTAVLKCGNEAATNRFHGNNEAKDYIMLIGKDGQPLCPPMEKQYVMDQFAMKSLLDAVDIGMTDIESSFIPDAVLEYAEDASEKLKYTAKAVVFKEDDVVSKDRDDRAVEASAVGVENRALIPKEFIITEDMQILTPDEYGAYEREMYESREYRGFDKDDDFEMEHEFGGRYFSSDDD